MLMTIEPLRSRSRSSRGHDRFLDLVYDKLGVATALQGEMWSIACDRFAHLVQGEQIGALDILFERAS